MDATMEAESEPEALQSAPASDTALHAGGPGPVLEPLQHEFQPGYELGELQYDQGPAYNLSAHESDNARRIVVAGDSGQAPICRLHTHLHDP